MKKIRDAITEATLVPISLVIMICVGIFGLSAINSKAQSATEAAASAQTTASDCQKMMMHLDERLSRMEGKLDAVLGGK